MPQKIVKRSGEYTEFTPYKIEDAIKKAFESESKEYDEKVYIDVMKQLKDVVSVEDIQDIIEKELFAKGYFEVMKSFMNYRLLHKMKREHILGMNEDTTYINSTQTIEEYINGTDWRIKANSNTGYSNAGLVNNTAGKVIANYWLDKVYSKEEGYAHRNGDYHIHDLDCLTGYCAGWSLRVLLDEGFNGVRGRIESRAPGHFREALGQMANFLGILQSEWAGAQAFSSFDTYLAPYVFKDKLDYKQVKKAVLSFVYNLNVPARWGQCVPETTKVLTPSGIKGLEELKQGDLIYTYIDGVLVEKTVKAIQKYKHKGKMHKYSNDKGFESTVSPEHKVLYKNSIGNIVFDSSNNLLKRKSPINIPVGSNGINKDKYDISDDMLELLVFILCDGNIYNTESGKRIDFYKANTRWGIERFKELTTKLNIPITEKITQGGFGTDVNRFYLRNSKNTTELLELLEDTKTKLPDFFRNINKEQASLILEVWSKLDGYQRSKSSFRIQCDNLDIANYLQEIATISGKSSKIKNRIIGSNKKETIYLYVYTKSFRSCSIKEIDYDGYIWCPTTDAGTAIFIENGTVFVSGNCPFTNVTIDWTVPKDLAGQIPTKEQKHLFKGINDNNLLEEAQKRDNSIKNLEDMTYKHFQKEMNLINKAYYEIMTEGDKTGQPFSFPIPTVNLTEDFDWYGENTDLLFENTAKIGSSYFQNFIGSQYVRNEEGKLVENPNAYKPGHVRSMCCRLQLDLRELLKRGGGLFGSAEMTGCYDENTEILTNSGWKLFKNLDKNVDKVLSMDPNKNIEWVDIEETYEYEINDNLYYFNRRGLEELAVTPNHRMLSTIKNGSFKIERADEIFNLKKEYQLPFNKEMTSKNDPKTVKIGDKKIRSDLWYKFLGIYMGDGYSRIRKEEKRTSYEIIIAKKSTTIQFKEIEKTLIDLGYKYSYNEKAFAIYSKSLAEELSKYGKAFEKHAPKELFNYSSKLCESFLSGLRLTDYCKDYFYTVSPELKNDIQILLTLTGKGSFSRVSKNAGIVTSYKEESREITSNYDLFEISEFRIKNKSFLKKNLKIKHYEGKVNCVTVKHGTVCVRRNGSINWSGNSIGVVTINMARLGYLHKDNEEALYENLNNLLDLAKSTLEKKRVFIQQMYDRGLYPYTKRYLHGFNSHFSTIGLNGINEMIRNFSNDSFDISEEKGMEFCFKILNHIRSKMVQYQEETGNLYNLEATPAEGTTYRFAKEDIKRFKDIIQAGTPENNYYTNSSQLPANFTEDPFEALDLQDEMQCKYTGGTVLHLYMKERLSSAEACRKLVKNVISNYKLPYITITPVFSVCTKHGYISGEHEFCPLCDEEILKSEEFDKRYSKL